MWSPVSGLTSSMALWVRLPTYTTGEIATGKVKRSMSSGGQPSTRGTGAFLSAFEGAQVLVVGGSGMPLDEFMRIPVSELLTY